MGETRSWEVEELHVRLERENRVKICRLHLGKESLYLSNAGKREHHPSSATDTQNVYAGFRMNDKQS